MICLDATFLLLVIHESVGVPRDPTTGKRIAKGRERVEHLIDTLDEARTPILIPTPVLAEVLVREGAATAPLLAAIRMIPGFKIGNFDERAAVELAQLTASAIKRGKKRGAAGDAAPYQKIKIDRQIVAIAKVERATTLYSDDRDLRALAREERIQVIGLGELPLPPVAAQPDMFGGDAKPKSTKG